MGPELAISTAMVPPTAAPPTLAIEMRELALTRVKWSGSSRGTADAWVTVNAFEATRQPRATGNSHNELSSTSASTQHRNPAGKGDTDRPPSAVPEAVQERPDERRDDSERSHCQQQELGHLRPSLLGGQGEEQVPASDTATVASPAAARNCTVNQPCQPALTGPTGRGEAVHGTRAPLDLAAYKAAARRDNAPGALEDVLLHVTI